MDEQQYKKEFGITPPSDKLRSEKALELALDIRKFEIELYWKRATYFWTFIAAAFGGYAVIYTRGQGENAWILLVFSCLGFLFSIAWYFVNRGSKFWQNNWERHVDLLEDEVVGPLYKTIAQAPESNNWLTASGAYSVSKINQILSFFVSLFWLGLIIKSVWRNPSLQFDIFIGGALTLTLLAAFCLFYYGRSEIDQTKTTLHKRQISVER